MVRYKFASLFLIFLAVLTIPWPTQATLRTGLTPGLEAMDEGSNQETEEPEEAPKDLRPKPGEWDVDMPLGPTQNITFDTEEGTWMGLDIHPSGEVLIFDMLGDLYLLPLTGGKAQALTRGAGYDMQPRFSPDGKQVLFTSDRSGSFNLWLADFEEGTLENERALTSETSTNLDGGYWDPSGQWVYARKRLSDTSSIGVTELWTYHLEGGGGIALVDAKKAGEVDSFSATKDGRYIYLGASSPFRYERNPHTNIWSIRRYDRTLGTLQTINSGYGSSASPLLSPNEKQLAFIRRKGQDSTLWIHDLKSGREYLLWDQLDRDQIEAFGTHGAYSMYAWTPDSRSLVIWAKGKLWKVGTDKGQALVENIPFSATVETVAHEPLRQPRSPIQDRVRARVIRWPTFSPDKKSLVFSTMGHLYSKALPDGPSTRLTKLKAFEFSPSFSADGRYLAFTTWLDGKGGSLVILDRRKGTLHTRYQHGAQLANPAFSADGKTLVFLQAGGATLRGSDLGWEEILDLMVMPVAGSSKPKRVISTNSRGASRPMTRPRFSANGQRLFYLETESGSGGGPRGGRTPGKTVLVSVKKDGTDQRKHLRFKYANEIMIHPEQKYIAVSEQHNAYVYRFSENGQTLDLGPNGTALPMAQLSLDGGEWVDFSSDGKEVIWGFGTKIHRAKLEDLKWTDKPATRKTEDLAQVLAVSLEQDGGYLFQEEKTDFEDLKTVLVSGLEAKVSVRLELNVAKNAPWQAVQQLKKWSQKQAFGFKVIEPEKDEKTDDDEKQDPLNLKAITTEVQLDLNRAIPKGTIALSGARLITMNGDQVIENGVVVITGDRITALGPKASVTIPEGARIVEVTGKTIIPGLVDVHAHMGYGVLDITPQKEWRYFANLAYGVTTTHDPSASSQIVFGQGPMVEAGLMVGPRVFSTGYILYGAHSPGMAKINSYEDALSHVRRLKALGAFSVKSYMQPRRNQRQWVIKAARAEGMLVVPEGGGEFEANMGMILDGHSGIEHTLSLSHIYQDVIQLFAKTKVGLTPTLLVSYGGQSGENWFYQHYEVWKNQKLQSFHPPGMIDSRSRRRTMSAEEDYHHPLIAAYLKEIVEAGGLVNLGAHGQLQGLGAHWELWALTQGGMDNHDALRCATMNGATYLGMEKDLGSLEIGKLADLAVLDGNPLDKIENSAEVSLTMINGFLYDSNTMDRIWPTAKPRGKFHFQD